MTHQKRQSVEELREVLQQVMNYGYGQCDGGCAGEELTPEVAERKILDFLSYQRKQLLGRIEELKNPKDMIKRAPEELANDMITYNLALDDVLEQLKKQLT